MELKEQYALYGKAALARRGYYAGQLELTTRCFQNCAFCHSKEEGAAAGHPEWTPSDVRELLDELQRMGTFECLSLTGGDPQAWPHLDELLGYYLRRKESGSYTFALKMHTALMKDVTYPELWRQALMRVRVSFDGITPQTFKKMRGVEVEPWSILERAMALKHPHLSTFSVVTTDNIKEVPAIIEGIGKTDAFVKASFGPALNVDHDTMFWEEWKYLRDAYEGSYYCDTHDMLVSFSDSWEVRSFLDSKYAEGVRCHAGSLSFHIKANGDIYPCCIMGGESLATAKEFRLGNWHETLLMDVVRGYYPVCRYTEGSPCRTQCMMKQAQLNLAGHQAKNTSLVIP